MADLIRSGKVKDVYAISDEQLEFIFSDRISVFDKIIPSDIPHKGETLARTSTYWFDELKSKNIPTHFIKLEKPNRMLVKRVNIIPDYSKLSTKTKNYLIPLELVTRSYVYGSLWDRVKSGKVKPQELGFNAWHALKQAEQLPEPFFEVTTKLEHTDRNLTTEEAMKISGITKSEFNDIKELCLKIDGLIDSRVRQRGLIHVDGKKEFAYDTQRSLMVVDTFGTADEDRFWNAKDFDQGRYVEKSKEFVRQFYRDSGYHEKLYKAREEKKDEPQIPALPNEMVKKASAIYVSLYESITGLPFR